MEIIYILIIITIFSILIYIFSSDEEKNKQITIKPRIKTQKQFIYFKKKPNKGFREKRITRLNGKEIKENIKSPMTKNE